MREIRTSSSMRGRRKRATAQRACALLYRSPWLDFIITLSENHLRCTLKEWISHYNHGRPHRSLGPGIPAPLVPVPSPNANRHQLPNNCCVKAEPVLGGLHHEYTLQKLAA